MMKTERRRPAPGQIAKIRAEVRRNATQLPSGAWQMKTNVADTHGWTLSDMYSREYARQLREFVAQRQAAQQ